MLFVVQQPSCVRLCDPLDCSLTGFPVHGIFQARILEWVAISFARGSSQPEVEPTSPALAGGFFTAEPPGKHLVAYRTSPTRGTRDRTLAPCTGSRVHQESPLSSNYRSQRLAMKRVPTEKPFQFLFINFHIYFTKIKIY